MASALALSSASAMASSALPQVQSLLFCSFYEHSSALASNLRVSGFLPALISIPANPTYNLAKNRGHCAQVSSRSSRFCNGDGLSLSRAASCSYRSPINASSLRRSFVVRAEAQSDAEAVPEVTVESEATVEAESAGEAVAVALAEPEEARPPRKLRTKLGDIMGILNKRAVEASQEARPSPDIRTGDVVEIKLEVPENRRRLSIYKGIVISRQNAGIHTTIRIRRIIAGVGVEIVFPLYSPSIKEIKVLKHRKVRRARLYYLRDKLPRLSTFK